MLGGANYRRKKEGKAAHDYLQFAAHAQTNFGAD